MPYLIGIAGPSGSGKTYLAEALGKALAAPILSLDCYYRELSHLPFEERSKSNFDAPDSLDHGLLRRQLAQLAAGAEIEAPVYDFTRHTRADEVRRFCPAGFVIVEGLFALYWDDVRALLGTKVYVELPDPVCFERRLERDMRERGRSRESVCEQYDETVRPMAERYIAPTRRWADVVVGGADPIARSVAAVLAHAHPYCDSLPGRDR